MCFIGIDGGGTKTTLVLIDPKGNFLTKYDGGPTNPLSTSIKEVEKTFVSLIETVRNEHPKSFKQVIGVFAGIAGTESHHSRKQLTAILQSQFGSAVDVLLYTDALTALYSGTNGDPGIVNIAGTGSITFGITNEGKEVRVGGWGYLTEHHGSGYGIGRLAIQKMFEAHDGLRMETTLTKRILERFSINTPPQLISCIYDGKDSRARIASICEDVFEEWLTGDQVAESIIKLAFNDICRCINGMITQYFRNDDEVKVVLAGSVFKHFDRIQPLLEAHLPSNVAFIYPKLPPVAGAVIAGYRRTVVHPSNTFIETLQRTYQ
ncbi:N-acetylglucosamine kinase [Pseudalkalibacillus decolorationis]|uniref:N-acetylglucosamine kinase n=1 Tax=Pseudalkalibacillus decolorationis TaxID=163879 RepID=UPI0021492C45|nr:BadF/BadG/BcrA/BcrD ATPase family protein [Pseudalkalibacillus decolorationis]